MKKAALKALLFALILAPAASAAPSAQQAKTRSKPLLSEDFESGTIDRSIWSQDVTGDNTLTVQQDRVAHGKYALLVRCPVPAQRTHAFLRTANLPESLRHHLFGRAYVYIAPALPDRHIIFLTAGTSGFPKYRYQEVASAHGLFQLTYVDTRPNGPLLEDYHAAGEVPLGRWFLLEWEFNDEPDQATLWVDGEEVLSTPLIKGQSADLVGGFTDAAFGFLLWGAAPVPFDIYYDDIALDTHRIGPIQ
jgi:hypothetical protein